MIIITLTLLETNKLYDFTIGDNVAYSDGWFQNGTHNNGGWKVKEKREEIRKLIQEAIKKSKNDKI